MEYIYYSPKGYWRGKAAISKLANASAVKYTTARDWLSRQANIYLALTKITYSHFDVIVPNEVHQADLLFLPHDNGYKYALTVVDIASRFKQAEPLRTKSVNEVASAFEKIYRKGPLRSPNLLQVDPGKEFQGAVASTMKTHNVTIRRGNTALHHDQAIVERFNRTLDERLFGYKYAKEFIQEKRSREWAKRLPGVVAALNSEITRTINMKPNNAIKKYISQPHRDSVSQPILGNVTVRYLYEPGELTCKPPLRGS